ncbi:hypothetical protein NMG60_11008386 [Bertholletia excelsa]
MEDQYGMADLRQYMNGRASFPAITPPPGNIFTVGHHYEMLMAGRPHHHQVGADVGLQHTQEFRLDAATTTTTAAGGSAAAGEMDGIGGFAGVDGTGRWPRQETLALLEIRSRLDSKFKEANQKGPLWDEVSRIMSEEHGYQRSGKKCREKFENLYKYYKKTKEGKAGRQDGKHYRFFRQLEALYGDSTTTHLTTNTSFHFPHTAATQANQEQQLPFQAPRFCDSLSLSNSSEPNTSSSDVNDEEDSRNKRRGKRSGRGKIKDFIDSQMRKLMEKQEEWLEKIVRTIESKEQERIMREEVWRKQEAERIEREHKFWAKERAWIEARDVALMEALQKITGNEVRVSPNENGSDAITINWPESEVTKLIQVRNSMESRFEQGGCSEEALWAEVAAKMSCLGYERSSLMCKEKWDSINEYLRRNKACNSKKRKEIVSKNRGCSYFPSSESVYSQEGAYCEISEQGGASPPPNSNASNAMQDGCFRFLVGADHGESLWENYGVKINKGGNH